MARATTTGLDLAAHHVLGVLGGTGDDLIGLLLVDTTGFDGGGGTLFGVGDDRVDQVLGVDALFGGDVGERLAVAEGFTELLGFQAEDLGEFASTGRTALAEPAAAVATVTESFRSGRLEGAADCVDLALGEGSVVDEGLERLRDVSTELLAGDFADLVHVFLGAC